MTSILSTPADEPFPYSQYFLEKKEEGKNFVGLFAHEMVPVEIIRAASVHIVPLIFVGPEEYSATGGAFITHSACSFARNIVGGFVHGDIGIYKDINALVRTNYCNGDFIGMEYLCREFNIPCINLSIPVKAKPYSLLFFTEQLKKFKAKLEKQLGLSIDDKAIKHQVHEHNAMRAALRKMPASSVRGTELLSRYQEATVLEPGEMCSRLDALYFKNDRFQASIAGNKSSLPKLLFTGDPLFINDFFGNLLEECGASISYFDTWIGARIAEVSVDESNPDVYMALARSSLFEQGLERCVPSATETKIKHVEKLVVSQNIKGIINHTLKFCDFQAIGRGDFKERLGAFAPVLDIERDYAQSNIGGIKTRVEAFMELVKGGAQ